MSTPLSNLVDNLSDNYKKKKKKKNANHAKKEKNIISECKVIGLKNNRLHYKCK